MEVVIVYESLFGRARQAAEAVAAGVREAAPRAHVVVLRVTEANLIRASQADLLVVGGPTHGLGLSTPSSRRKALRGAARPGGQAEPGADGPGIREWLTQLPRGARAGQAAAFDTRCASGLPGAAGAIARRLRQRGFRVVLSPRPFIVDGPHGPLAPGEKERARAWGAACYYALGLTTSLTH